MKNNIELGREYKKLFYKTGNPYFFLIAQEFSLIAQEKIKIEQTEKKYHYTLCVLYELLDYQLNYSIIYKIS